MRRSLPRSALFAALFLGCLLLALGPFQAFWAHEVPPPPPDGEPLAAGHTHCEDGFAGPYPCRGIELMSLLPRSAVGAPGTITLNDIWGWTDPEDGREYALVGLADGVSFVDVTEPEEPRFLGKLPTRTFATAWRDIKTYRDHAYIVADNAGGHGMQVFDLRRLRGAGGTPQTFQATAEYFGPGFGLSQGLQLGSAHNLAINEETGFAYVVGSNTCAGGLHMVDLAEPGRPRFAGCFEGDGYTHDAQCVVYHGPDAQFLGREICIGSNEDTVTVVDVTDKETPVLVSRPTYAGVGYSHQSWLTEDHAFLIADDELDEIDFGHRTRTYVWDMSNLAQPRVIGIYQGTSTATDHNLYVRGGQVYQANYTSGLRVLDLDGVAGGELDEIGFFDIMPESEAPGFSGAWSVYPFFASGSIVVSGIQQGLFVLRLEDGEDHHGEALQAPRRVRLAPRAGRVAVAWRPTGELAEGFRVYRSIEDGPMELLGEVAAARQRFVDRTAPAFGRIEYGVSAFAEDSETRPVRAILDRTAPPEDPGGFAPREPGSRRPRRIE